MDALLRVYPSNQCVNLYICCAYRLGAHFYDVMSLFTIQYWDIDHKREPPEDKVYTSVYILSPFLVPRSLEAVVHAAIVRERDLQLRRSHQEEAMCVYMLTITKPDSIALISQITCHGTADIKFPRGVGNTLATTVRTILKFFETPSFPNPFVLVDASWPRTDYSCDLHAQHSQLRTTAAVHAFCRLDQHGLCCICGFGRQCDTIACQISSTIGPQSR
jgi:hypothetical protein